MASRLRVRLFRQILKRTSADCLTTLRTIPQASPLGTLQGTVFFQTGGSSLFLPPILATAAQQRFFRAGSLALGNIKVQIQSMGESISEGSVAAILKRQGDSVAEDETIAQIETDKVTIDVKSPTAGSLAELRVQVDDTVKVGQIVAIISEGEGGVSQAAEGSAKEKPQRSEDKDGKQKSSQPEPEQSTTKAESSSSSRTAEEPALSYKPMLKFPKRMTNDGMRISDLPSEEREKHQDQEQGQAQAGTKAKEPPAQPKKVESQPKKEMSWYVGKEQGTKLSQSQVLSQKEMEMIELGGAEP